MDDDRTLTALVSGACLLAAAAVVLAMLFSSAGCTTQIEHTAPQLEPLRQALLTQPCAIQPLPQRFRLVVDGDRVDADADGEAVLRAYASARSCWQAAHSGRAK